MRNPAVSDSELPRRTSWQSRVRALLQDWRETEGQRWIFVLKTLIAAFLALWIAFRLGFDSPRSAMMTVFIVALPSSGMALEKGVYRLLGTLVGCGAALAIVGLFPQQPVLLFLAVALWVGLCTCGSALMRNARSYGFVLAGYTVCMITLPAIDAPLQVFDLAVARVTEISVGILCAAFINDALFPKHQSEQFVQSVRNLYSNAINLFHDAMQGNMDDAAMERQHLHFATEVAMLEAGRTASWFEAGEVRARTRQLHAFNASLMVALTTFHTLHRLMQRLRGQDEQLIAQALQPLFAQLSDLLLVDGKPAQNARAAGATCQALQALEAQLPQLLANVRNDTARHATTSAQRLGMDTALELFQRFHAELLVLARDYHSLAKPQMAVPFRMTRQETSYSPSTPPAIVLVAGLRGAIALLLLALAWYGLNWPSASGAVILTVVFCGLAASSPDPDGLIRQTTLGFTLAVPFAFFCAFFMLNHIEGYTMLVLAMAPFLLAGCYLSTWRKVAGIGIGFNLMFAQMIAPENIMRFNVTGFLNDSLAQVIGLILAALVFVLIFPAYKQGEPSHIRRVLWREAWQLCVSDRSALRRRFESRMRDLLNQLNMGMRGVVTAKAQESLNQAIALLEIGHAIIDLRMLAAQLPSVHPARSAKDASIQALASYFRTQQPHHHAQALAALQSAEQIVQVQLLQEKDTMSSDILQRALTDLHLIHSALLDTALQPAQAEGKLLHAS